MDRTGVPVPEHLWFVGQVPDLPLLQNLSMAGREPAPQPSPNVETPDTGRNCFPRGEYRLRRSRTVQQRGSTGILPVIVLTGHEIRGGPSCPRNSDGFPFVCLEV